MVDSAKTRRLAALSLMAMSVLWGSTYFIVKDITDRVPPLDLIALRFSIASVLLILLRPQALRTSKQVWRHGLVLGAIYSVGYVLQVIGIQTTSASRSGFLTGMFVVATPIIEAVLLKSRVPRRVWSAVALAVFGMAVLTLQLDGDGFGIGEALTLVSAVVFALHIALTGQYARGDNALSLSTIQLIVIALVGLALAVPDGITLPATSGDWVALLYLSIPCLALTMFVQMWAQAHVPAAPAAVIMATEPMWAAVFAIAVGGEVFTLRTLIGGLLMMGGMYIAITGPGRRPVTPGREVGSRP